MRKLGFGFLVGCTVAVAAVYYAFDPSEETFYPQCVFRTLTGYQCAGCGLQRAIHSLLHVDIVQAFSYNAYFVTLLPVLLMLLASPWWRNRFPRVFSWLTSLWFVAVLIVSAMAWWVLRNVMGW